MIPQNIYPAQQGFPRPPDGGVLVPTPFDASPPANQAFAPAPLVNPFPIEPTPPSKPFLPASQGIGPIPSNSQVIPPALEVTVADTPDTGPAPTYIVTEQGSIATVPEQAIVAYPIASVTDYDTGLPIGGSTINIQLNLSVGNAPLSSYGFTFVGRTLYFTASPNTPVVPNTLGSLTGGAGNTLDITLTSPDTLTTQVVHIPIDAATILASASGSQLLESASVGGVLGPDVVLLANALLAPYAGWTFTAVSYTLPSNYNIAGNYLAFTVINYGSFSMRAESVAPLAPATIDTTSFPMDTGVLSIDPSTLFIGCYWDITGSGGGGTWIPPGTTPQRTIVLNGDNIVVVQNAAEDGSKLTDLGGGPVAGGTIAVDTARSESEVLFTNLGLVQNVIPSTNPLLDPSGEVTSDLPVQNANVSDQATSIGTPVDYFPSNHHPI